MIEKLLDEPYLDPKLWDEISYLTLREPTERVNEEGARRRVIALFLNSFTARKKLFVAGVVPVSQGMLKRALEKDIEETEKIVLLHYLRVVLKIEMGLKILKNLKVKDLIDLSKIEKYDGDIYSLIKRFP